MSQANTVAEYIEVPVLLIKTVESHWLSQAYSTSSALVNINTPFHGFRSLRISSMMAMPPQTQELKNQKSDWNLTTTAAKRQANNNN